MKRPKRFAARRDAPDGFLDWVRGQSCFTCDRSGPSDVAHVRSRGAGGRDLGNVIPLCRECHAVQHAWGWGAILMGYWLRMDAPIREAQRLATEWNNREDTHY